MELARAARIYATLKALDDHLCNQLVHIPIFITLEPSVDLIANPFM